VLLAGASLVVLVLLGLGGRVVWLSHRTAISRAAEEIAAFEADVNSAVQEADQKCRTYDFAAAKAALKDTSRKLSVSKHPQIGSLQERLDQHLGRVSGREYAFEEKLRQGYVLFEGQLILATEKMRILNQREAIRKREEQERRHQEEQRRAEEARREQERLQESRRQEEQRRAEAVRREQESLKLTAYTMSQQFISETLKSPSSARFPDYSDHAVIVTYDPKDGRYTVMAWVEGQNAFGVYLRKNYMCVLWPAGGNLWKSSLATLMGE